MRTRVGRDGVSRRLRRHAALLPALLATGVFATLAASQAGFYPTTWYPAALFMLGLLATSTIAMRRPVRVRAVTLLAFALLAAYVAWTYLSIIWADQAGAAWDGANRAALYLVAFTLFALWPADARSAQVLLGAFALASVAVGLVVLLRVSSAPDPAAFFVDGRLIEPAGYVNATAAMWSLAVWPCLFLASIRDVRPLLRGLFLGGAGLLTALALMSQSRGWLLVVPVATVLFVALGPGRLRRLGAAAAVAAGTYAVAGPVLAIRDPLAPEGIASRLDEATPAVLAMAGALALTGAFVAFADRRFEPGPRLARAVAVVSVAAAVVVAGVAATAFIVDQGNPVTAASEAWEEFKQGREPEDIARSGAGGSRLSSVSTNRFDFWRVAWERFRAHPVKGIGIDNFQQDYLLLGRSEEQPRYPHSLELGVLSQTGIVGAALLGGALAAALAAALRPVRRGTPLEAAAAGAAITVFAYWFLHASVDWFWEFPGLAAPAFGMLGLATALGPRTPAEGPGDRRSRRSRFAPLPRTASRVLASVAVVAACALAASLLLPWLAARDVQRAADGWRAQPEVALERLERAADLNPLSAEASLVAGTIALRLDRTDVAERSFRAALERETRNAYAALELGAIASARGNRRAALTYLTRAVELSPHDAIYRSALERVRAGGRLRPSKLNQRLLERARELLEG